MKLIMEQKKLAEMLSMASRAAAPTGHVVPSLAGVHMQAKNGKLTLTASNLEIAVKIFTDEVEIEKEGELLANAHYFADFISKINGIVTLETNEENTQLLIKYGRSKGKINLLTTSGWSEPKFDGFNPTLTVKALDLKRGIQNVLFACATEHYRQVFTGVLFDITSDGTNLVASDTFRLAIHPLETIEVQQEGKFIIPAKSLNEFMRIFKYTHDDKEISISLDENRNNATITSEDIIMSVRLIDGEFPNYKQIIPKIECSAEVKTDTFKRSLDRVNTLPTDNKINVLATKLTFNGNGEMKIYSSSELAGEISETIVLEKSANLEEMTICFNNKYLHDIVKHVDEMTRFEFSGPLSPAVITGSGATKYVLVPMRVSA